MPFKMRYKNLEEVVDQLYSASKKHAGQAKKLEKHLEKLKSPAKATRKVCLPKAKIARMSSAEKQKVINAKQAAANQGKQVRSSKSFIRDGSTRSKGLRDWVKQDWRQVANPEKKCGEK
tara:strand:+ start:470 stop:826 length:357 start_codon:yes stop_codon:yes gene_type:complete